MSSNAEETDPGFKTNARKANAWADPKADGLLAKVAASSMTAVILLASHGIAFGLGMWAAW